ncbi:MAG TPA: hypothetical protein VGR40_09795 [Candidatus Binatus sp.]|nr:hypothetical protein [Candidatus Binatus sp.]
MKKIYRAIPVGLLVLSFCIATATTPARAWADEQGDAKSATTSSVPMKVDQHPSSAFRSKLKMHWQCFKSGGKWKPVTSTHFDDATKSYSETKTWACQKK